MPRFEPRLADALALQLERARQEAEHSQRVLAEKLIFLQTLIDTIPCPIFYKDAEGVYRGCNQAFEVYLGRPASEIVGRTVFDVAPRELAEVYRNADLNLFRNPGAQQYEASVRYADGALHDVIFSKATYCDANGQLAGLVGVILDITERKRAELAARASERRLQDVVQNLPLPTFVIGTDHLVRHWNRVMEVFSGIAAAEMLGTSHHWRAFYAEARPCLADLLLDGALSLSPRLYEGVVASVPGRDDTYEVTERLSRPCGGEGWLRATARLLRDADGKVEACIQTVEDVTAQKRAEADLIGSNQGLADLVAERTRALSTINAALAHEIAERKVAEAALVRAHGDLERQVTLRTQELQRLNEVLTRQSLQDGLTGISNRRYFDEFLEREWQRARRESTPLALIMADVDCFKAYNDTYGHQAGDVCLRAVAGVLDGTIRRAVDLVARYGGEEFVAVLPGVDMGNALKLAEAVRQGVEALRIAHRTSLVRGVDGNRHDVTISLGVACALPGGDAQAQQLVAAADAALYEAKRRGRNRVEAEESLPGRA